ncbi:MAG: chemotaxis protein CheA [Deltaproteobacteria bacterium]|jgi:two-component system, chemotaxis family, sensor kinase CheA|nr:chemotaxis protein CheA [Deltaproteobacteria bacterium]MBT4525926.1 chemotaxis protein CheA [Deltaproteobacteria bacterium]
MNLEDNQKVFREEAYEKLAEIEECMLELEASPDNTELISKAFRALHTIKGSGAMFDFNEIVTFTHDIENVYDLVRDNIIPVSTELISLTLAAHDHIKKMLDDPGNENEEIIDKRNEITIAIRSLIPSNKTVKNDTKLQEDIKTTKSSVYTVYRIRFKPDKELFATGTNPILLLNELRELGECVIVAHTESIPNLNEINPEHCYTYWDIILRTNSEMSAIQDVFIFVDDNCEINIQKIGQDKELDIDFDEKKLGDILLDRGDIDANSLQLALQKQLPVGEILINEGMVDSGSINSALAEQQFVKKIKNTVRKVDVSSSIRVDSEKLDKLVDLVGELVTGQARLSQIANYTMNSDLTTIAEEIERLTAELRDNTMSVRMLTFGTTFNKFKRLVRDLGSDLGKDIILITHGADTELDKTVIEQLNDPLVHILRNSIDHGIETPAVRKANHKSEQGTVTLSAKYSGAHVLISVEDDGAGLSVESIRKKAIEKGLITPDSKMTDKEIYQLIFMPGFSTAEKVTNVSGRGVGMDVVKKGIEALRGTVDVDSNPGKGSTITLKLPLTLAIIDGLLLSIGPENFIIPLAAVKECIELTQKDVEAAHGRHVINVRGQIVPYIRLKDQFHINSEKQEIEQVVITEIGNYQIGFVVDNVIDQHQTVIKNLSKVYKDIDGISGATIMADGTVALIIDINNLLLNVEQEMLVQYT